MEEKKSILPIAILIVIFVVINSLLVIAALNYFGIVNLSGRFNQLAFLPVMNEDSSLLMQDDIDQELVDTEDPNADVIGPDGPIQIGNSDEDSYRFEQIPDSIVQVTGSYLIEMEIEAKPTYVGESSGILFNNGLEFNSEDFRALGFTNYSDEEGSNWMMEFRKGSEIEYYFLFPEGEVTSAVDISARIEEGGKNIVVSWDDGNSSSTFELPSSLFEVSNQMRATVQIAPISSIKLNSLRLGAI